MPQSIFEAAVKRCKLASTTYTPRKFMWLDEPLIDFSREADPRAARECFNEALLQIDREIMEKTGAEHIGYIWATQE